MLLDHFLCIEITICWPKSVSVKRAAKTIMLHSCDVENCEDTSATLVEKGEIWMKGRTYCMARAPNDVSYKNNTHIPGIFIHYFPKDVAVWPKWTRSTIDRRHRGDFPLQCRLPYAPNRPQRPLLRTHIISQIRGR